MSFEGKELQQVLNQTIEIHLQKLFDDLYACCIENGIPVENMSASLGSISDLREEFDYYTEEMTA